MHKKNHHKKSVAEILFYFFVSLYFTCCCSSKVQLNPVYITDEKSVLLLPVYDLKNQVESFQMFSGKFGGRNFSSPVYIQCNEKEIKVCLMNEFGFETGVLYYDGFSCSLSSEFFPKNFKSEYIVCDLQNVYYKKEKLKENYSASGLDFQWEEYGEENFKYFIYDKENIIEEISVEKSDEEKIITIKNFLRDYEYKLQEAAE